MWKAFGIAFFLMLNGTAHGMGACDGLKRKQCRQASECRWLKAKKACSEKSAKKSAKMKKKATKKPTPAAVKETIPDDFSTQSEAVDTSLDEF